MSQIVLELLILFVLLVANGVFSMSEMAVVSARKVRLRHLAENGDKKAGAALELAESPNSFLATVQIGITLVGVIAAAFSGATMARQLAAHFEKVEWLAPYSDKLSLGIVICALTFLTLVIGELLPKRVGMAYAERIARVVARPMNFISILTAPLVKVLSSSTEALMRILCLKGTEQTSVTNEEVKLMVREGMRAGVFHPSEATMVARVMELDQVPVRDLMTPRARVTWINVDDNHESIWHKIVVSGHSTFPVYEGNRDRVVGTVSVKSIYANLAAGAAVRVRDLTAPALIVPDSQPVIVLLEKFKETGKHLALVADEFGAIAGVLTLHDIMEAIVGDIPSADERAKPRALKREDASWLIDGMLDLTEFEARVPSFKLPPVAQRDYQTLAGFVIKELGRVPTEGEWFDYHGFRVEIIDMDGHRVDKILLTPVAKKAP